MLKCLVEDLGLRPLGEETGTADSLSLLILQSTTLSHTSSHWYLRVCCICECLLMLSFVKRRRESRDSAAFLSLRLHQTWSSAHRAEKEPWDDLFKHLKTFTDVTKCKMFHRYHWFSYAFCRGHPKEEKFNYILHKETEAFCLHYDVSWCVCYDYGVFCTFNSFRWMCVEKSVFISLFLCQAFLWRLWLSIKHLNILICRRTSRIISLSRCLAEILYSSVFSVLMGRDFNNILPLKYLITFIII